MEMWLKHSTLMLFTVAVAGMAISPLSPLVPYVKLDKTTGEVTVASGSSLQLHCNLNTNYTQFQVSWSFNGSRMDNNQCDMKKNDTICILSNVTEKNSGLYSCTVIAEIPLYNFSNSSEKRIIILTVKNLMENATYPSLVSSNQVPPPEVSWIISWWMWILLGGSTIILTALLVICILLRRRWRRSRAPDPIYINTRPMVNKQPSPRPAGDKLKTAASAQNLRTPSPGGRYEDSKRRQRQGRC